MEHLTLINIVLAALGVSIHLLRKVISKQHTPLEWLKNNWASAIVSVLAACTLLLLSPDVYNLAGLSTDMQPIADKLVAFMGGFLNITLLDVVLARVKLLKKSD